MNKETFPDTELPCAFVSKRVLMQNLPCDNQLICMKMNLQAERIFIAWFHTKTRFETSLQQSTDIFIFVSRYISCKRESTCWSICNTILAKREAKLAIAT